MVYVNGVWAALGPAGLPQMGCRRARGMAQRRNKFMHYIWGYQGCRGAAHLLQSNVARGGSHCDSR